MARHDRPSWSFKKIVADLGIQPITLPNWVKRADFEDGFRPGVRSAESDELREAHKRIGLLRQEAEVFKRALEYVSWASIAGKVFTRS